MKETLEEAACVYRKSTQNQMYIEKIAFVKGAEWQAERMYSKEEVNDLLEVLKRSISEINHLKYTYKDKGNCGKYLSDCETIIEQFKKK